jgi:hypothetical protein
MKLLYALIILLFALESFKWYNQLVWNDHLEDMLCAVLYNTGHKESAVTCLK